LRERFPICRPSAIFAVENVCGKDSGQKVECKEGRRDANSFSFLVHREDDRTQAISERYLQKKRITFKDTFTARRTVKRSGFAVFHLKKKMEWANKESRN
jgi:hypothetical protein